ncbi:MAG: hypothetical protein HRT35_26660 [Algicola sp.]|nr:hypothetical protein [Algicola sp.]
MKWLILFIAVCSCFAVAQQDAQATPVQAEADFDFEFDFEQEIADESQTLQQAQDAGFIEALLEPARFTVKHELSNKYKSPKGIVNNRSSLQFEYDKFFLNNFYLRFDGKLSAYWQDDHRAKGEGKSLLVKSNTREAFLQGSFGQTSIKIGRQTLIWGVSDGGAITDVISPRNLSEIFLVALEESRIGQNLINIDQFTDFGDFSAFYVPKAKFNDYARVGTAYYFDPFNGQALYQDDNSGKSDDEYGLRWKRSFGKSDISLMAASLIDNNYALRQDGFIDDGRLLLTRTKQRYKMAGLTFNYVLGKYLFTGEIANKTNKAFNNGAFDLLEKDQMDISIGVQYAFGNNDMLSVEVINNHIAGHDAAIVGFEQDAHSLVFSWLGFFLFVDLSVNWMTVYSEPHTSYLHSIRTSYKYNDDVQLNFDAHYVDTKDPESGLYSYRDQAQVVFKVQYQF